MLHQNCQLDSVLTTEYNRTRDVIINLPFLSWFYLFTAKKELDSFHHLFAICYCKILHLLHLLTFFMKLLCLPSRWTLVSTRTKKILHFQVWTCCGKCEKSCLPARMYALRALFRRLPIDLYRPHWSWACMHIFLFNTTCKRGLRVNSIENEPLASFIPQNHW